MAWCLLSTFRSFTDNFDVVRILSNDDINVVLDASIMITGSATDHMESDNTEKNDNVDIATIIAEQEPEPHIHIKTLLVVFV